MWVCYCREFLSQKGGFSSDSFRQKRENNVFTLQQPSWNWRHRQAFHSFAVPAMRTVTEPQVQEMGPPTYPPRVYATAAEELSPWRRTSARHFYRFSLPLSRRRCEAALRAVVAPLAVFRPASEWGWMRQASNRAATTRVRWVSSEQARPSGLRHLVVAKRTTPTPPWVHRSRAALAWTGSWEVSARRTVAARASGCQMPRRRPEPAGASTSSGSAAGHAAVPPGVVRCSAACWSWASLAIVARRLSWRSASCWRPTRRPSSWCPSGSPVPVGCPLGSRPSLLARLKWSTPDWEAQC